jgi:hypothetical protein
MKLECCSFPKLFGVLIWLTVFVLLRSCRNGQSGSDLDQLSGNITQLRWVVILLLLNTSVRTLGNCQTLYIWKRCHDSATSVQNHEFDCTDDEHDHPSHSKYNSYLQQEDLFAFGCVCADLRSCCDWSKPNIECLCVRVHTLVCAFTCIEVWYGIALVRVHVHSAIRSVCVRVYVYYYYAYMNMCMNTNTCFRLMSCEHARTIPFHACIHMLQVALPLFHGSKVT